MQNSNMIGDNNRKRDEKKTQLNFALKKMALI